ncbi:MAG: DNA topoisomerase, partial [Eubacteriales bacterium]|nr:DNA topoisomerase [Eubacteriales bacterium]
SVRVSDEAKDAAKQFIFETYGEKYYPETPNVYKAKKEAQDAHEAIRPSEPSIVPDSVKGKLSADSYRLYKLIWERFIASQMKAAEYDTVNVDINAGGYVFKASGRTVKFMGFMAVYGEIEEDSDDERSVKLPQLNTGEKLEKKTITSEQKFTQPPSRFTEGSLIKMLEEKGIGRPSTYTPTISTITARGYVQRNGKFLEPTELGRITTGLMKECFPKIIDYDFTANMEADLDKVEEGCLTRLKVLDDFYKDFEKQLEYADKALDKVKYEKPVIETDIICEKCGSRMVVKEGRYGKFAACPNYPSCKNTKKLNTAENKKDGEKETAEVICPEKCPKCGGEMTLRKGTYGPFYACRNYPECKSTRPYTKDTGVACPKCGKSIVMKQSKTKRIFYSCTDYPNCDFSCWDMPLDEKCPVCGAMLLKKKHKNTVYCSSGCGWSEERIENQNNS